MTTELRKLMYRIGHRGAFLIFLFLLDELYGYSLWVSPFPDGIHWFIPPHIWAIIWAVVGVLLFTGVFFKSDQWHFALAALIKVGWGFTWVRISIFDEGIVPRSWIQAVIWLAFAAITIIVATWTEPPRYQRIRKSERELE